MRGHAAMQSNPEPLWLDFESGDLSFWTTEGQAFEHQPIYGDKVKASRARPGLVPLGGDYWDGPYPVGHQGTYWISTEDYLTGTLISDEFTIDASHPWFSFLIGGGCDSTNLRVELLIKVTTENREKFTTVAEPGSGCVCYPVESLGGRGDFYRMFEATGNNNEIMGRVIFNTNAAHLAGERACIRIIDSSMTGHINVDDFRFSVDRPQVTPITEGGGDLSAPVWGFADLHTHPMAFLAFGGIVFWGRPDGPIETALGSCTPAHGIGGSGLPLTKGVRNLFIAIFEATGYQAGLPGWLKVGHAVGGYPHFDGWPKFTTTIHQQMYVDWVKRA